MKYPGFIGPSYQSQTFTAGRERLVNLYLERVESPGGAAKMTLCPVPGVEKIVATNATGGRAHEFYDGREFVVIGTAFAEVDEDGTITSHGTVAIDANPATISWNGPGGGELLITSGGNGYLFTLATNTLSTIANLSGKATMGDMIDGYFLALDGDTGTLYSSELLDGTTWTTGVMFAQRSAQPDPWVAFKVKDRQIYLLGSRTGEVWYNAGTSPFPFAPNPSGGMRYGTAAPFSLRLADDSLLWLGQNAEGHGMVCRATNLTPEVVSTYPVQYAISGYATVSDAYGDAYSEGGHTFYILTFPGADQTWVYDLQIQQWHERGSWVQDATDYSAFQLRSHASAFGEHRWLHASGNGVYRHLNTLAVDVDDYPLRRERIGPTLEKENQRLFFSGFELFMDPGQGLTSGQGSDPQVMLRFSGDGGQTWSSERWRSAGKKGQYGRRARWERLGSARRGVVQVVMTDPIPWRISGAAINVIPSLEGMRA